MYDAEETDSIIAEEEENDMQTFRVMTDGYQHSQQQQQYHHQPSDSRLEKTHLNYESFGQKHKIQGYERFDQTVQSKLYFMKQKNR